MKNILGKTIPGLIFVCLLATGCPSKSPASTDTTAVIDTTSNTTAVTFAYSTAVITHFGFDFATGLQNDPGQDGHTIGWMPESNTGYSSTNVNIWWSNEILDTVNYLNQTKDMGAVDISTVTSAPASWDVYPNYLPLTAGHTIVAKCKVGYAKFEVITTDTTVIPYSTTNFWPALVRYYYSPSATFAH